MHSIDITPPNSLVLIMDSFGGRIPDDFGSNLIVATESCIAIGCRSELDGPTKVTMGIAGELFPLGEPFFSARIQTAGHRLTVQTVYGDIALETEVDADMSTVSVWVNDYSEPDEIVILLS